MKNIENGIQLKIDKLILSSNLNNNNKIQLEKNNEITTLITYVHCLDLFDFLENYSKIQKNELLFQISFIYDFLGYNNISLEYINEALKIIPNVPTIILFKSCLYSSMNNLDEAQKLLLKYKYLIGEDFFCNYIYNIIRIIYYYFLNYEENIILREINIIEIQNQKHDYNNTILFYIKSKLLDKLSEKYKEIDIKRSNIYKNDSILNKEKAFNSGKLDAEYLFKFDINKANLSKILTILNPNFLVYRPKPLIDYNNNFHFGFTLFYILFKICKIIKLKILLIKLQKISKIARNVTNLNSKFSLDKILYSLENNNLNIENTNNINYNIKELKNGILTLSKNVFIQDYLYNKNRIKKENNYNELNNININEKLKTNYYIYKDFYSNKNLKGYILKNINRNNEYKKSILSKDSFLDEAIEKCDYNTREVKNCSKIQSKDNILEENEELFFKKKLLKNKINKRNKKNKNAIISKQSKFDITKNSKDKKIRTNITIEKTNSRETNQFMKSLDTDKNKNKVKKPKFFKGYYKNIINNNALLENKKTIENKKNSKDNKKSNLETERKEILKKNENNRNKLNENKKPFYKNIKTENSSIKHLYIFSTNKLLTKRNLSKYSTRNSNRNEKKNNIKKQKDIDINNILFKNTDPYLESDTTNKQINNSKSKKNNNSEEKLNYNYKLYINKTSKLNNTNYGTQKNRKNENNSNYKNNKNGNKKMNDLRKFFFDKMNDLRNNERTNRVMKKENNKLLNNIGKKLSIKNSKNKNKSLNYKSSNKNYLQKIIKKLENKKNKNDLSNKRSDFNSLKKNKKNKKCICCNKLSYFLIVPNKDGKSLNYNIHNKIKSYLGLNPIKKVQKIENLKKSQLSIEDNFINNLTINLNVLPKTKINIPINKKTLVHNLQNIHSKGKINKEIKTSRINSSKTKINLKKKLKNRLINKGSRATLNSYKNSKVSRATYYFDNIINKSISSFKTINNSANK